MLRLPSARAIARVQLAAQRRAYAELKAPRPNTKASIANPKPPVFPGGASAAAPTPITPATLTPTAPTQVPLISPTPKTQKSPPQATAASKLAAAEAAPIAPKAPASAAAPAASPTPPPPPPPIAPVKPVKKTHKIRNTLVGFSLLGAFAFGGGVFLSLKSDNFHDFFTEYVPLGEEAVLYIEEREFRRRFPNALAKVQRKPDSPKVTIPKASGATWKLSEQKQERKSTDVGKPGPHLSSITEEKAAKAAPIAVVAPLASKKLEEVIAAATAPLAPIELSNSDPVVQDLINSVNSIIATVNATGSAETFGAAIATAKSELEKLNAQVSTLKTGTEVAIQEKLSERDLEFAQVAQGLMQSVNNQVEDIQHTLRDEFEAERERISHAYQRKLQTELERSKEVAEQRLRNELLEQAIEMKRNWIEEIEGRVERERGGRLGKLKELEKWVEELESLTLQWNDVINTNLKTQQTFTALEAVRASYESSEQPKPFLREMAALLEVGAEDEVVAAAIASINPAAYQRGVSTPTQLIDRFRRVSGEVRRAALLPEDAGIAAHAGNWVLSKLMFKKSGLAQGNDVESILAKTEAYLEEGDVDSAAREMNQLSGWARTLASDWMREARLLLEVQQAVDVIGAEARVQSLRVQEN